MHSEWEWSEGVFLQRHGPSSLCPWGTGALYEFVSGISLPALWMMLLLKNDGGMSQRCLKYLFLWDTFIMFAPIQTHLLLLYSGICVDCFVLLRKEKVSLRLWIDNFWCSCWWSNAAHCAYWNICLARVCNDDVVPVFMYVCMCLSLCLCGSFSSRAT